MIRKISSDTKNSLNTVKINWKQNGNKLINIYIYIYIYHQEHRLQQQGSAMGSM